MVLLQAELAEYKAHSPHAAQLSPQIYGLGVQQRVDSIRANAMTLSQAHKRLLHDPSLAECTFRYPLPLLPLFCLPFVLVCVSAFLLCWHILLLSCCVAKV